MRAGWILSFALLLACRASAEEPSFVVPTDPTRAVLNVTVWYMDGTMKAATLFADGRAELAATQQPIRKIALEPLEVQRVLGTAATYRLMEWDAVALRAKMMRTTQRPIEGASDADRVRILLSVDDYHRGPVRLETAERTISYRGVRTAIRRYPEIQEFRGLDAMVQWMYELHRAEAGETSSDSGQP